MGEFKFALGEVVLAEWEDKLFYAKIEKIDSSQSKCLLIFDDDSVEECPFTKIHSVTETTAEIVCIICKDGRSSRPNEIVLCDKCGVGYHQRCHQPNIPASALEIDAPWMCVYCAVGALCPYLENPFDSKSTKKGVSRKRRITSSIKSDGFASSGNSTEDEGLTGHKFTRFTHRRGMSRFYLSTHREGPKPRGRPSFSHKLKMAGERRGRGGTAGRPLGRSAMREGPRESNTEREYCFDAEVRKTPPHHFQRQSGELSRHQRRYNYPVKDTTNIEEYVTAKPPTPKAHETLERNFSHMETEFTGNNVVRNHHSRPRDAPREKQRLTQDLARQKRLLSEDIARAELLHREQISKKVVDVYDDRDEVECVGELSSSDPVVNAMGENSVDENAKSQSRLHGMEDGEDLFPTLYEKCYGDNVNEQEQSVPKDQTPVLDGDMETEKEKEGTRESLFERFSRKGDIKSSKYVNDNKIEVKGLNCFSADCETNVLKSSSSTASANSSSGEEHEICNETSVTENLEPLQFENVTDDEFTISLPQGPDISASDKNRTDVDLEICAPEEDEHFPGVGCETLTSKQMCPDLLPSVAADSSDSANVSSSEKNILDACNFNSCDCQSELDQEDERVTTVRDEELGHQSQSAPGSSCVGNSEQQPDHSIIKTSKLDQIMAEPDIQCEHSSKYADESISEQVIACSLEYEGSESAADESHNCVNKEENLAAVHSLEKESARTRAKENGLTSEWENPEEDRGKEATPVNVVDKQTLPVALVNGGHKDPELSNNEGMSDAGELSEPDIAARVARGKVKTKKRKKKNVSGKLQMKSALGNPRSKGSRGRFGNRRGKSMKGNRRNKVKTIESDSEDNEMCATTENCVPRDKELNNIAGEEGERAVPSTTTYPEEGDKKSGAEFVKEEERGSERRPWPGVPADGAALPGDDKEGKDGVSSAVVDNSEDEAEIFSLTESRRKEFEEQGKKERVRKEKRLIARQKRKSDEKERATPPHLVSQNRFARDLPRHNWLVEQLLQQKKLCGDVINSTALSDKKDTNDNTSDVEDKGTEKSDGKKSPEKEANSKSDAASSSGEPNETQTSPGKESFHSELQRSFLKRGSQVSVPRAPPKLKPSTESCSEVPSPLLKHKLPPRETPTLEPLPKLRKIVAENREQKQEEEEVEEVVQKEEVQKEAADEDHKENVEQEETRRKAPSPIEILDDEEDKQKCALEPSAELKPALSPVVGSTTQSRNEKETTKNSSPPTLSRSMSFSPPRKAAAVLSAKRRGNSVSPKEHMGRPLHMSPHRAAILIPVAVPMHDGGGGLPPGLTNSSPHLKGYPPRTFTPHLLTHSSPLAASSLYPGTLSSGVRYPGNACMHQHMGPKSGGPCKRDVNCPFHGNQGRGVPLGPMGIPSHLSSISTFRHNGHEHLAGASLNRHRHDGSNSPCTHPDCKVCHLDKDPHSTKDTVAFNDKGPGEVPKVVKPIAHVPGTRAPLMLPHLQQHGRHPLYRGLEELHEEKARRIGGDLLFSLPHKMQKPGDKVSKDHIVPSMLPLHDRLIGAQPLTLSELNRRREEELSKARGEEARLGLKSKVSPRGDFILSGLPSPSRTVQVTPHSKEALALSPARSQGSAVVSQAEQKSPHSLGRRIGDEKERSDYASYMSELLKSGPPRLRPTGNPRELVDHRMMAERQKHEELLILNSEKANFMRHMLAKDASEMFVDRKSTMPRRLEQSTRNADETEHSPKMRLHSSHGNAGILSMGLRELESARGKEFEERKRPNSRETEGERLRNEPVVVNRELGRRGFEILQAKEKEKREESRGLTVNRELPGEFAARNGETGSEKKTRSHLDRSSHSLLSAGMSHRFDTRIDPRIDSRIDPRMMALREMELHRRLENNRLSDLSHRDMLSRMALSLSVDKGKPAFGRPDGISEQSAHDPSRIRPEFRCRTSPNSGTVEYSMPISSRQALDRLAAAAGKSGGLAVESRIKQEMERERERERHQMSLEQYDANRRLLHAELKDKVNPLVFSKERAIRAERERELEAMRTREKLKLERERLVAMERFSEDRKRKRPDEGDLSFAIRTQRTPPPGFGRPPIDRDEYERLKRMRLVPTSTAAGMMPGASHRSATSVPLHVEIKDKDDITMKKHPVHTTQRRVEPDNGKPDVRLARSHDLELGNKGNSILLAERGAMWLRERERIVRAQEELSRSRATLHGGARISSFMRPKPAAVLPSRDGNKNLDEEGVNRCCVCKCDASFLCSGCQAAWYCSPNCQLSAWAIHSQECDQNQKR